MWFESSLRWRARRALRSLRAAWQSASAGEDGWLSQHLRANARSLFGLAHHFAEISSSADFQRSVPIRPLWELVRSTADLRRGLSRTLTIEQPACVAVSEDGEVPLAGESRLQELRLWQIWAAEVEAAHPGALAGSIAVLPEASGGRSFRARGIPVVPGEFAVPWVPARKCAVPARVARVKDPTLRGFLAARFALAREVTLLSARSAADLAAFGRIIQDHAPSLIRAIHDGALGVFACEQPRLCAALGRDLRPDPARARALERAAGRVGVLRPADAWPGLKALAVRSSAESRALWPWYGDRPLVQAGLFVGPERIGLPLGLAARSEVGPQTSPSGGGLGGRCALTSPGLTEFLPEAGAEAPLRQHQLRDGEAYRVVLTTPGGLYRAATEVWVRAAGRRDGAVLVEPCPSPRAERQAPPHLAS